MVMEYDDGVGDMFLTVARSDSHPGAAYFETMTSIPVHAP